jgi:hypothetical protein
MKDVPPAHWSCAANIGVYDTLPSSPALYYTKVTSTNRAKRSF